MNTSFKPFRSALRTRLGGVAAAALLASAPLVAQAAGDLVVNPANTSVDVGQAFAVQVRGQSFVDNVVGGGFGMSFDPSVLSLTSVVVNSAVWDFLTSPGSIDNVAGTLSDTFFNAFTKLPTGNFDIATLNFVAKAPGASVLQLMASSSFPFANDAAQVIAVDFGSGNVNVVPEPATWGSMLLGLALLPLLRRRQRAEG